MARKGIPQEIRYSRNYVWTRPFRVSCDEFDRETWVFTVPVLGSLVWHRPKLCWIDLQWYLLAVVETSDHAESYRWLTSEMRVKVRLWNMWDRGIRATEKR